MIKMGAPIPIQLSRLTWRFKPKEDTPDTSHFLECANISCLPEGDREISNIEKDICPFKKMVI